MCSMGLAGSKEKDENRSLHSVFQSKNFMKRMAYFGNLSQVMLVSDFYFLFLGAVLTFSQITSLHIQGVTNLIEWLLVTCSQNKC